LKSNSPIDFVCCVISNYQLVELRVTLQSILHRLNDVESSEKQNVKIIDGLRKENEKLKFELSKIKEDVEHHIALVYLAEYYSV
jgi:hypothetical protein